MLVSNFFCPYFTAIGCFKTSKGYMHHQVAKIKLNENLSLMPLVYNFIITLDEKGLHCTLLHYLVYPHPRLPKYLPIRKKNYFNFNFNCCFFTDFFRGFERSKFCQVHETVPLKNK